MKKKYYVIPILILLIGLLGACSRQSGLKESTLNVNVLDKYNESISADVELIDPEDDTVLDSGTGQVVSFNNLKSGEYRLKGSLLNGSLIAENSVVIDDSEENADLKFYNFAGAEAVQKHVFAGDEEVKEITIENLTESEKVIVGIANLEFDANNDASTPLNVSLTRNITVSSEEETMTAKNNVDLTNDRKPVLDPRALKIEDPQYWREMRNKTMKSKAMFFAASEGIPLPEFGPYTYDIGDKRNFYTDYTEQGELATTLRGKGDHCYIFVADDIDYIEQETIDNYVEEFDNNIFPTNTEYFASRFDIDQNDRLIILLEEMGGASDGSIIMGYFHPKDFFSQYELDTLGWDYQTNEGDMIYLNAEALQEGWEPEDHFSTIAHEFQHELWWISTWENGYLWKSVEEGWKDDTWINEGMSTYAEQINGYTEPTDSRIYCYFDEYYDVEIAETSLLYWNRKLSDYGISNLFTNYIVEQYGKNIIDAIYEENINPRITIEEYTNTPFAEIFINWSIANKLYSLQLEDNYGYQYPLEGNPVDSILSSNYSPPIELRNSAVKYYIIEGKNSDITLEFNGDLSQKKFSVFTYRY